MRIVKGRFLRLARRSTTSSNCARSVAELATARNLPHGHEYQNPVMVGVPEASFGQSSPDPAGQSKPNRVGDRRLYCIGGLTRDYPRRTQTYESRIAI